MATMEDMDLLVKSELENCGISTADLGGGIQGRA